MRSYFLRIVPLALLLCLLAGCGGEVQSGVTADTTDMAGSQATLPSGAVEEEDGSYTLTVYLTQLSEETTLEAGDAYTVLVSCYDENANLVSQEKKLVEGDVLLSLSQWEYDENDVLAVCTVTKYKTSGEFDACTVQKYDAAGNETVYARVQEDGSIIFRNESTYSEEGVLLSVTTSNSEGVVTGQKEYREDGSVAAESAWYADGTAKQMTTYHENGQLASSISYYSDGTLESQTEYSPEGDVTYTAANYADGTPKAETEYTEDGTGRVETTYYENGNPKSVLEYDGDILLTKTFYYESGQKSTYLAFYANGNTKEKTQWHENGLAEAFYSFDEDGNFVRDVLYDENGQTWAETIYHPGINMPAEWIYWNEDGSEVHEQYNTMGAQIHREVFYPDGRYFVAIFTDDGTPVSETGTDADGNVTWLLLFDENGMATYRERMAADGTIYVATFENDVFVEEHVKTE